MARIDTCGFENQSLDGVASGAVYDTTFFNGGTTSVKCDSGASLVRTGNAHQAGSVPNTTGTYTFFVKSDIYVVDYPAATVPILDYITGAFPSLELGTVHGVTMDSTGALFADFGNGASSASSPVSKNGWHTLEAQFEFVIVASTSRKSRVVDIRLDGVSLGLACPQQSLSGANPQGTPRFETGWCTTGAGTNKVMYVDNLITNTDLGANQNSWPGPCSVVLLLPISDNARATLWTGGIGGTTNLWNAVNNSPPIGTATETDLTQIEHAGGAAGTTDAYDANMTSYATAGIQVGDKINTISFCESDGEDSATGTKLLAFSIVSNPAIATPGNVTAGDDVGALGTYPSNWSLRSNQAITYNPSVTLATSPVMRVVRPETATRVASVCFMGMIVDYTPGNRYPKTLNANQARNRAASF